MNKILFVIDMQNDFIDGSLGTKEAELIVPKVVEKIKSWEGDILYTQDLHEDKYYLNTNEGKHLPIKHCIFGTDGYKLNKDIDKAIYRKHCFILSIRKKTFGSTLLPDYVWNHWHSKKHYSDYTFEIIGLCTDVCVISNALLLKTYFPEAEVNVDASCCAGSSPEAHEIALKAMENCQIEIINKE